MGALRAAATAEARARRQPPEATAQLLGPAGHGFVLVWLLALAVFVPQPRDVRANLVCLVVVALLYPRAYRRILGRRFWSLCLLLAIPTVLFVGTPDRTFIGLPYSGEGLRAGALVALRLAATLLAIDGFTRAVDIAALAGALERLGLRGLGFALGVALNLLPELQTASRQAWQTLRMRGGLRRQRRTGLRLLGVTVLSVALRRAEEIALAAEARGYAPERSRPMPVRPGLLDWLLLPLGAAVLLAVMLL